MIMTNYEQRSLLPAIYIQEERDSKPLGAYGVSILKNMKTNYTDRYWQLTFNGTLMEKINAREQELTELKLRRMDELEHRFPRPKTDSFLAVASHMNSLAEEAGKVIEEELKKPV